LGSFSEGKARTIPLIKLDSNTGQDLTPVLSLRLGQTQEQKPALKIDQAQKQKPITDLNLKNEFNPPIISFGSSPRAFRVRSMPDQRGFSIKPLGLDIVPISDLFSTTITEISRGGRKATQQPTTKKTKREYGEYIRSGGQIFPTQEIKEGKVKLWRIKL
jgi:hypothetical protein